MYIQISFCPYFAYVEQMQVSMYMNVVSYTPSLHIVYAHAASLIIRSDCE